MDELTHNLHQGGHVVFHIRVRLVIMKRHGRNEAPSARGDRSPHEARECRPWLVLLAEHDTCMIGQPGHFLLGDPSHQHVLAGEAPVHRAHADAGAARHVLHGRPVPQLAEDLPGRAQHMLQIPLGVYLERR